MASSKSEFRFVVDGVDLTEGQKSIIAAEIQKAGLLALQNSQAEPLNAVALGHHNLKLRPEWLGLWVFGGGRADEIGQKVNDIGFFL